MSFLNTRLLHRFARPLFSVSRGKALQAKPATILTFRTYASRAHSRLHDKSSHLPSWYALAALPLAASTSEATDHTAADKQWPRPGHPYGWIDAEAEELIAKAYQRHRALANTEYSFPPSRDATADLEKIETPTHYPPQDFVDRVAWNFMRFMRVFVHAFFREKYDHHAVCLETVAAVPGIVGAFHRHLRSLRRMEGDNSFIEPLLEEAENERMHLLIWMQVTEPTKIERAIVVVAQGVYLTFYSFIYFFAPRAAHRLTGYLEEEAHAAYTSFLHSVDKGEIDNKSAPPIAISYYNLSEGASIRDVILHVRSDEAAHREFNHHLADKYRSKDIDSKPVHMDPAAGRVSKASGSTEEPCFTIHKI